MKKKFIYFRQILINVSVFAFFLSCNNSNLKKSESILSDSLTNSTILLKPPSTFKDTMKINFPAAVFYLPDSIQLSKIKAQTNSIVFDGSMHEFFYQMRNARIVIKKLWPSLRVIEAKNYRYILFIKKNKEQTCIDLNTKNDAYGLFVFEGLKPPLFVDMTNLETVISVYLKE